MSFYQKHPTKIILATFAGVFIYKFIVSKFISKKMGSKIIVVESVNDWKVHESEILLKLRKSEAIGMDCEWVTEKKRKKVSLLQLANSEGFCVLIRLSVIPNWFFLVELSNLLEDKNVLKVGVGVCEDSDKLYVDYCFKVAGCVDLRYLAKDIEELQGKSLGLKSLSKKLLGYDLNKSIALRCSRWDSAILTEDQIKYAADDAIISAKLYECIKNNSSRWFAHSNFDKNMTQYIDLPFKQTADYNNAVIMEKAVVFSKNKNRYCKPRSKPMYDNCQLVAPDGELLCSCDRGKAQWYVYKELGEIIKEDPLTVRLNFEPSGRPTLDNVFYTKEKSNCCVACGKTKDYHRKFVVPSEYRRHFPDLMKKNLSHDVLLLCLACHKRSNILDHQMRLKLAELCDAPLIDSKNAKYKTNPELVHVKNAASALQKSGHKIPETRRKELETIILDYYHETELTEKIMEKALISDINTFNKSFIPHGLKVYQYFCKNRGMMEFERIWRKHFLDVMEPKHLPAMWSVEHNHERLMWQIVNHERDVNFDVSILGPELVKAEKTTEKKVTFKLS